ncbi:MAG: hypothetical protein R2795_04155 [Saprospiraceae bacterium]
MAGRKRHTPGCHRPHPTRIIIGTIHPDSYRPLGFTGETTVTVVDNTTVPAVDLEWIASSLATPLL